MRTAETLLNIIQDRGKRQLPLDDVSRQLDNPELSLRSYAKRYTNDGAMTPGITAETGDGWSREKVAKSIEAIRDERWQWPPVKRILLDKPKGGKRPLGLPVGSDKVVQDIVRSLLEAYDAPQCSTYSHGCRPKRGCHTALHEVGEPWTGTKWFSEGDIKGCFDNIRHHLLLAKVAQRVNDPEVLQVLKLMLKVSGKKGVAQGGVLSPLLSNLYLTAVDQMLERAKEVTRRGPYTYLEYARFADDLVILVDAYPQHDWLLKAVDKRLREELATLQVAINEEKSRIVDLAQGEQFSFLGFDFRRVRSRQGVWRAWYPPKLKKRTALLRKLKEIFRRYQSQPIDRVIALINPILRGWVRYFAVGDASRCFGFIKDWVEKKVRRHLMRARKRRGFGWKRWSRQWLYQRLGLFNNYRVQRPRLKALPTGEVP